MAATESQQNGFPHRSDEFRQEGAIAEPLRGPIAVASLDPLPRAFLLAPKNPRPRVEDHVYTGRAAEANRWAMTYPSHQGVGPASHALLDHQKGRPRDAHPPALLSPLPPRAGADLMTSKNKKTTRTKSHALETSCLSGGRLA